jgi:glycosyltransferase involved in cell wall biosynthesis
MSRIAIVAHSAYPSEPRSRRMAEALAEAGYDVTIFCLQQPGQPPEDAVNGVRVVRLPVVHHQGAGAAVYIKQYMRFFWEAGTALRRHNRKSPFQLVQVHNPPDALAFCAVPLKLRGVPLVLDLRELTPELFMSRFSLARSSAVVRGLTFMERSACAYANAVLVLHDRHRDIMLARGVPARKLTQVMNCPDERLFDLATMPSRRPPDDRFAVLYHGGIMYRYGVDLLVEAVARVRQDIPGIQLELYGGGDLLPEIERLIAQHDLTQTVNFHGIQPLEAMPAAIAAANVGVAPLRQDVFTDCVLPTKLLEYVALGLPAIAARTATTTDYFDESMVLLHTPGDANDLARKLLEVYRDPAAANARAERTRSFTEAHNWRNESAAYLHLIQQMIGA